MIFIVLMYSDPAATKAMSVAERDIVAAKHERLRTTLLGTGELRSGAGMGYPADTRTIRLRGEAPVATDGPLVAGDTQLTAFYILDCGTTDRAYEIAEELLDFHVTAVEVRQVHDSLDGS